MQNKELYKNPETRIMNSTKKVALICLLSILFLIVGIFNFAPIINKPVPTKFYTYFKEGNLRTSNFWNLTGTTIFIDDQDPNYNWSKTAKDNDWCSGLGTKITPYLIENVFINVISLDVGINIVNSSAYFIIKNCSIINSNGVAGISLNNVTNGLIINNNCSNNPKGILLRDCHNNTILENHLFNNNDDGIFLQNSNFTEILGNNISYSMQGITLVAICNNNTISLNKIAECGHTGIALEGICNNNTISLNKIAECGHEGINLSWGNNSYNLISDNEIKDIHMYSVGIFVGGKYNKLMRNSMNNSGIALSSASTPQDLTTHSIDTTNLVNGKPIYYYANETHLTSNNFSNAGHILLVNCNDSVVSNMDFTNVISGIMLYYCDNNLLHNISIKNNMAYGITLISSDNITFLVNGVWEFVEGFLDWFGLINTFQIMIFKTNLYGIRIIGCMNNTFLNNYVYNSSREGFSIDFDSNGNTFWLNFIINNFVNALDNSNFNKWDNGSIGNYWDDYIGTDSNNDNIGDLPYDITGTAGSKDYYPIFEVDPPSINLLIPNNYSYHKDPPNVELSIISLLPVNSTWYTILGSNLNRTFNGNLVEINMNDWFDQSDGPITIRFYVNDSKSNIDYCNIVIIKDTTQPLITVNSPLDVSIYSTAAPTFNLTLSDINLQALWYTIDDSVIKNFILVAPGENLIDISQGFWDTLPEGSHSFHFFVNDSAGNENTITVIIVKEILSPLDPQLIPGFNILIVIGGIIFTIVILNWKKRFKSQTDQGKTLSYSSLAHESVAKKLALNPFSKFFS